MAEDDAERVDWGHDEDEQQAPIGSDLAYSQRQTIGGYAGEDAEDAVSLGGDDEDEREFYAHHSTEQISMAGSSILVSKSTVVSHSLSTKRDSQRQSATSPQRTRTPSQSQNPESPNGDLRQNHSASNITPAPMTHALPPKPVLVPPLYEPPSTAGPGILASAMAHRQKNSNGSGKTNTTSDGGDPLPPDWEIRYPRNGGKDAYYFNVKTEESTWIRPRLPPSGSSSPSKDRESGSGRRSPDLDATWSDRSGRGQGPRAHRRDTSSRNTSPPPTGGNLTYEDRHYRPSDASVPAVKTDSTERRDERAGARPAHLSGSSHGRTRSPSPQTSSDRRWRRRSVSPARERVPRRNLSPDPLIARADTRDPLREFDRSGDVGWGRSQREDAFIDVQIAPRSPSHRRTRRKDDVEPPLRRRKDDTEPSTRQQDDIEPPLRRKDDVEPWIRRKDDIEPPLRRKDEVELPLRRRDDIEPPIRPLPRKHPSTRHENDEWPASRPPFREPSPPRRFSPSTYPPPGGAVPAPTSSNAREPSRYERSDSPSSRYPSRDVLSNAPSDGLPIRRPRDGNVAESAYDNPKRRRLNDDPGPSRRMPPDLPPPAASLPAKPSFPPEGPSFDTAHRRRAPLPPQDQQWRENLKVVTSAPPPVPYEPLAAPVGAGPSGRYARPRPDEMGGRPYAAADQGPADRREDRFRAPPDNIPATTHHAERPSPRDVEADRLSQPYMNGPGERRSRFDLPIPSPSDRMEVDVLPASRMVPTRGITGGMHADRMVAEPPRGPRAMAPRDGPGAGYSVSPNAPGVQPVPARYNARGPPAPEPVIPTPGRGRVRLGQPEGDRRWEPHDSVRRPSYSAPSPAGPLDPPPRRADAGMGVPRDFLGYRRDDRVPPPRISGTNNIPIGAKSSSYASDQSASNVTRSPVDRYRPANDQGDLPRRPPPAEPDSYDRRRLPLPEIPPSGLPRNDRAGRRLSLGHDGPLHARGSEPISDRPGNALPPRPRDDIPPRQSRFGPSGPSFSAPPDDQPRIWQTRDEAQSARAQDRPIDVRPPRDEVRPLREGDWDARAEPPPPRRWAAGDSYVPSPSAPESMESRTRAPEVRNRPLTPPPVDAVRRSDEPLVEHPVVGKLHPERARWLSVQAPTPPGDADRSSKGNRTRRSGRSPGRGYGERMQSGDSGRDLPPRSADDTRLPPLRERSPIPLQNGHRPDIKRGGSLLDRLSLNDTAPTNDGGSSLRDRVGLAHESNEEVAIAQVADQMEVDAEGSGYTDDGQKGSSRGLGRRRGGKSRRFRRN